MHADARGAWSIGSPAWYPGIDGPVAHESDNKKYHTPSPQCPSATGTQDATVSPTVEISGTVPCNSRCRSAWSLSLEPGTRRVWHVLHVDVWSHSLTLSLRSHHASAQMTKNASALTHTSQVKWGFKLDSDGTRTSYTMCMSLHKFPCTNYAQ